VSAKQRLRRELFRGIADDNLEVIRNQPRGSLRRERTARMQRLKRALFAGGGALLAIMTVVLVLGVRSDASSGGDQADLVDMSFLEPGMDPPMTTEIEETSDNLAAVLSGRQAHPIEPSVIPLAVRKVAIDAGHGGIDSGTKLAAWGMYEKDLTLDIADRLRILLERTGREVILTRSIDEPVSLKERVEIANHAHADLFVSIHINWVPNRESRGFETYFAGATVDPFLKQLAAVENVDSGFSVADTRRLLDGIYSDVRQQESKRLAEWVGRAMFMTLKTKNPEIFDRGVLQAPFVVLVATDMPAVLAEVACLSNDREARLLALPKYRQSIAEALLIGIHGYAQELSAAELEDDI
jgi:N-acetylmuramoyl-L-alanine amidase